MKYINKALVYQQSNANQSFGAIEHHFSFASKSYSKPYCSLSSSLILSLAILPHSIRLIKNAIFLSLATSLCILSCAVNTKLKEIFNLQLHIFLNNIGLVLVSIILPICRGLMTIAYGYGINSKYDNDSVAIIDEMLIEHAWGCGSVILRDLPDWWFYDEQTVVPVTDDSSIDQSSAPNLA